MQSTSEDAGGKKRKPKLVITRQNTELSTLTEPERIAGPVFSPSEYNAAARAAMGHAGNGTPPEAVPRPNRKIAVMGSAVSSSGLTPFDDPSWEIWSCSPANKNIPRCDVWFELHNPEVKVREGLTEWMQWLKTKPCVYMQQAYPGYLGARRYPLEAIVDKWGPYWWTSQLSFMLALAIEQKPRTIGIYGVDMAANSEYNQQRLACQFFLQHIMTKTDIELIIPPESDILEPPPFYAYCESSRQWRKYYARKAELQLRIGSLKSEADQKAAEAAHLIGALDDMEYHLAHWATRRDFFEQPQNQDITARE